MTTETRLADALDLAAEAFATLALEFRAYRDAGGAMPPQEASPAVTEASWTETDDWEEPKPGAALAGSASVCPAHNIEYRDGRYGKYCPSIGTDPRWTNEKGYCTLTPKNAAAYLRQKAAR